MKEKQLETLIIKTINDLHGRFYRWVSPKNEGVPRCILCFKGGISFMCEVKSESGTLTAFQELQIKRLLRTGQNVCVCYGVKGLVELLNIVGCDTTDIRTIRLKEQIEIRYQKTEKNYNQGKLLIGEKLQEYIEGRKHGTQNGR